MAKRDNFALVLMMYPNVKLQCGNELLICKYLKVKGKSYGTWWVNGVNTEMQCMALIDSLKEKNKPIKVIFKRSF